MSDTTTAIALLEGYLGTPLASGAAAEVAKQRTRTIHFEKLTDLGTAIADAMAADATAEKVVAISDYVGIITGFYFTPNDAITAHNTNYFTVTINKYTAAGATKTSVATLTLTLTSAGSIVEFVRTAGVLSVVAGATTLEAGAPLTITITKAAAGLVCPAGIFTLLIKDQ